jgi:hypothetical protein
MVVVNGTERNADVYTNMGELRTTVMTNMAAVLYAVSSSRILKLKAD